MKVLIVVDMQKDFVDGALGSAEAVAIVPAVKELIEGFDGEVETAVSYPDDPEEHVQKFMDSGMKRMDAIKAAAAERGMNKREFYALLIEE